MPWLIVRAAVCPRNMWTLCIAVRRHLLDNLREPLVAGESGMKGEAVARQ